jgi:hypothetical protein
MAAIAINLMLGEASMKNGICQYSNAKLYKRIYGISQNFKKIMICSYINAAKRVYWKESSKFDTMKLTAIILATYMALLTVQPVVMQVVAGFGQHTHMHCAKKCCQHPLNANNPDNCCTNGICNTFQLCGCCFGLHTNRQVFNFNIAPKANTWLADGTDKLIAGFYPDNFQPPEMSRFL